MSASAVAAERGRDAGGSTLTLGEAREGGTFKIKSALMFVKGWAASERSGWEGT